MANALRTGFTGYYGMRNFGDDLFGVLCASAARRYWSAEPSLVGPPLADARMGATMPHWYPLRAYGASGIVGGASRLYGFVRGLLGSDVMVMGGGSVIGSKASFRRPMLLRARRRGVRLAAVGVSVGPFADAASERAAAAFVEQFDYVSVRDQRSYEQLLAMGLGERVHAGRDLAGLLPQAEAPVAARDDRIVRIGIAPCHYHAKEYPAPTAEAFHAALAQALSRFASANFAVDVFSLNDHPRHGDRALADALHRQLSAAGVRSRRIRYRGQHPLAIVRAIADCDAFVSARLHGGIVAYLQGVPFALLDYHAKCRDFARDVALPDECLIRAGQENAHGIGDAISFLLAERSEAAFPREDYAREAQDIFRRAPWATEVGA